MVNMASMEKKYLTQVASNAEVWQLNFIEFCCIYICIFSGISVYPYYLKRSLGCVSGDIDSHLLMLMNISDILLQFGATFYIMMVLFSLLFFYGFLLKFESSLQKKTVRKTVLVSKYLSFSVFIVLVYLMLNGTILLLESASCLR